MKREALYNKTVDILVQAYFNDSLEHSNCHACAVGNLIAANMGYSITTHKQQSSMANVLSKGWDGVFVYELPAGMGQEQPLEWLQYIKGDIKTPSDLCLKQIASTGYSPTEINIIEEAFESVSIFNEGDKMFKGLMRVVEALDKIHENTDEATTTSSKNKFNKSLSPSLSLIEK